MSMALGFWLACICSLILQAAAEQPVSYPIEWENVPAVTPGPRNLESPYLGECICDVTWGSCDPNCCCDSDCGEEERNRFEFCFAETVSHPTIWYCNEYDENRRVTGDTQRYLDERRDGFGAICVVKSNNAKDLIPFFVFPKNISKPRDVSSNDWLRQNGSRGYTVNGGLSLMKRVEVDTSTFELKSMGLLSIPVARHDGYCTPQGRRVRFMNPIDTTGCVLKGGSICTLFSSVMYENLFLTDLSNSTSREFTPVTLQIFNETSGELLATVDSNSSIPVQYQTVINGTGCQNAVIRVKTSLVYNSNKTGLILTNATSKLYVRDINLNDIASMLFQTEFLREGMDPPSNYFPGAPGYFDGSRVRAGTLVENNDKAAIAERVAGFSVPSGGRSCYQNNYRKTGFLHDVRSSGCSISVSEGDLRDICSGGGTGALLRNILSINAVGSPGFDVVTRPIDHVARTSDAHTNDTSSWIHIEGIDFGDLTPSPYDSVERKCSNIYVGLQYKFIVSRVGAESNPQNVLVAAFADPIIGSWKIRNNSDFTMNATSTQWFRFEVAFSWADPYARTKMNRRVIAPPILPHLDDTVFYPFKPPR
ncbi:Tectonic-1 [Trypanosoma grayi]|uniref:Tectonic-1 n=1 Tax=Trypanosoma grayi TaxID=71804 RepID=UPI0004F49332|nr:Tectonic-1 [Trypanosoma grayi]KEG12853.1 Tectonic-1 [Trypanosoma grayi]